MKRAERRRHANPISREIKLHKQAKICASSKVKRALDIILAIMFLIILSPVLLAAAILIKITSEGPVLFIQERVGLNTTRFKFIKLRSMRTGVDQNIHKEYAEALIRGLRSHVNIGNETVFKMPYDMRITPVGKIIRKLSIDEIPQFLNVIKGEMSIVGPRPPVPYELKFYNDREKRRLLVKPGMTGLWQVTGRSTTTFERMVAMDLYYISKWSIWMDIEIIFKTFSAIFDVNKAY